MSEIYATTGTVTATLKMPDDVHIIRWTDINGGAAISERYSYEGACSPEMIADHWKHVSETGWTPIRWWKFWRLGDTPNPLSLKDPG